METKNDDHTELNDAALGKISGGAIVASATNAVVSPTKANTTQSQIQSTSYSINLSDD